MLMAAAYMPMDSTTHSSSSSSASSTISPPLPWHHHQLAVHVPVPTYKQKLRPGGGAARRPSSRRKVPTTYITADPVSFRRMVHQVTGADVLLATHTLCAPSRAGALKTPLPTLDTSALLLGNSGSAASVRPAAASEVNLGAGGGAGVGLGGVGYGGGGFPTLESWDALL